MGCTVSVHQSKPITHKKIIKFVKLEPCAANELFNSRINRENPKPDVGKTECTEYYGDRNGHIVC